MFYSIIIPVFNRPDEIRELLDSLTKQTYKQFEVLIIEDGSDIPCKNVIVEFKDKLDLRYFIKENSGQGFTRNFGFENARGDFYVVFDSDCLIPPHYFETVTNYLINNPVDCWGGPDKAENSFTPIQKAINFSMTSFLTTGGIRGSKLQAGPFHPRSFNMGISREVYQKTGGYNLTRMGEDIEFSIRIGKEGFKVVLIEDAYVYHKRRTNLKQFFWQLHFFGRARINIKRIYPEELRKVHLFPVIFLLGLIGSVLFTIFQIPFIKYLIILYLIYAVIIFITALFDEKDVKIALISVITSFIQLTAYAVGLISELLKDYRVTHLHHQE